MDRFEGFRGDRGPENEKGQHVFRLDGAEQFEPDREFVRKAEQGADQLYRAAERHDDPVEKECLAWAADHYAQAARFLQGDTAEDVARAQEQLAKGGELLDFINYERP